MTLLPVLLLTFLVAVVNGRASTATKQTSVGGFDMAVPTEMLGDVFVFLNPLIHVGILIVVLDLGFSSQVHELGKVF